MLSSRWCRLHPGVPQGILWGSLCPLLWDELSSLPCWPLTLWILRPLWSQNTRYVNVPKCLYWIFHSLGFLNYLTITHPYEVNEKRLKNYGSIIKCDLLYKSFTIDSLSCFSLSSGPSSWTVSLAASASRVSIELASFSSSPFSCFFSGLMESCLHYNVHIFMCVPLIWVVYTKV
jgi:hypothetical protein